MHVNLGSWYKSTMPHACHRANAGHIAPFVNFTSILQCPVLIARHRLTAAPQSMAQNHQKVVKISAGQNHSKKGWHCQFEFLQN